TSVSTPSSPTASTWLCSGRADSRASLGWGDDPPCPPRVGVLARWAGGVCQSTGVERGSCRLPPRLTTYHLPLATRDFRLPPSDFRLPTSAFPASHHARLESRPARFVVGDGVGVAEREADVVEAFHQAPLDERVDVEAGFELVPVGDGLFGERHGDLGGGVLLAEFDEVVAFLRAEFDREQADLGAVGAEDVGERRGDDRFESPVLQTPWGVLAAGAGTEVGSGHEDLGVGVLGALEHEVGVLAPVGEDELAVAGAFDPLEVLLGHDLVGVDVRPRQRSDRAGDRVDRVHVSSSQPVAHVGQLAVDARSYWQRWAVYVVSPAGSVTTYDLAGRRGAAAVTR